MAMVTNRSCRPVRRCSNVHWPAARQQSGSRRDQDQVLAYHRSLRTRKGTLLRFYRRSQRLSQGPCLWIACHDDGISPRKPSEPVMRDHASYHSLLDAVERYFDLMFDGDVSRFGNVFAPSAQLHGLRDGSLRLLSAQEFKNALAAGPSPKSRNAPRQQELLLVDFASPTQALVKVRVRIDTLLYLDYLSYHHVDSAWLITAKSFHIEQRYGAPNN